MKEAFHAETRSRPDRGLARYPGACHPALAAPTQAAEDMLKVANYSCADNDVLSVAYMNTAAGNGYAVVLVQDELLAMAQQVSASGAIYKTTDPNYDYTLMTKGRNADLLAVTNGKEEYVMKDCVTD